MLSVNKFLKVSRSIDNQLYLILNVCTEVARHISLATRSFQNTALNAKCFLSQPKATAFISCILFIFHYLEAQLNAAKLVSSHNGWQQRKMITAIL